jgi:multisubunit Na+/H+ antiporter MnhE subunit
MMKFLVSWAALAGLCLLIAGAKDKTEIPVAVAVIAGLLLAALLAELRKKWRGGFRVGPGELSGLFGPLPVKVCRETWSVLAELFRSTMRGLPLEGIIIRIPYRLPAAGSADTRIALITAVSTLPPNTIVIGYEKGDNGGLIVHQLAGPPVERREGPWPL